MISNGKDTSLKQVEAEVSTKSTSITPTKNELFNSTSKPTPTNDKSTEQTKEQLVVNEKEKKKQAFVTRTIWTFVMIGGFFAILASGHLALIIMVSVFQMLTFKEVIALTSEPARDKKIPWNRSLNWYFLGTTWYYLDFPALFDFFQESVYSSKFLTLLVKNHKFISYSLYIAGFVFFVWTLKKGYYRFQFAQLCVTHMTLLLVVFQAHLIIDNILQGIIWFFLPATLVIVNDIFAYLCGITFGRTQLIEISPKKTVEGFVGAWICTGIAGVIASHILSKSDYMICPAENLSTHLYNFPHCDLNPIYIPQVYQLPANIVELTGHELITFKPFYFHAAILATFASLIAPFGGFFASGLKRAFGIKDFGDTIPGHGGITDRFDCQFLMGSFTYLYYHTFVSNQNVNLGHVLQLAIMNLSVPQLLQLIKSLLKYLNREEVLTSEQLSRIFDILEN
ncbi:phosphatidate cytidylyltransferase [Candida albicans P76067]|uniref:Phosphatidate cytidylyltransferase n=2 Tax=Candida albicans TaxID=5476 RepID=A0A1D8PNV9_CANAL|nr:phosphatidate cytidylyltransferase [Candida albicans SC5314]KAF6059914.1 Cytidylyltransferase family protein [Candida albicans]KGQ86810.1 phosphatidate cytidylyltransferase [Candida albicans P37005]KGT66981.1 phosphatidate cytidylyltransferase [Candida albicans 12C]KGU06350.1 phosphatidate cytidylyltransferase [Candida albicans 19F]KHC32985.1 phosphatidate cytidylyltransferase [Candida albicans P76067]|eukprot:XP_710660.2 phosphatidate cytidylyltransferase [Candida albicans SC5314]